MKLIKACSNLLSRFKELFCAREKKPSVTVGSSTDTALTARAEVSLEEGNKKLRNFHSHAPRSFGANKIPQTSTAMTVGKKLNVSSHSRRKCTNVEKTPKNGSCEDSLSKRYDAIPELEMTRLPRGGCTVYTEAVGYIQAGIPPETIKDSMRLGLEVPSIYIVPADPFCRENGPALGVNLAEFEFPAYYNYFMQNKRCTLIVESEKAKSNICRVFSETLLGPAQFRRAENPIPHEEQDFSPNFPRDARPDFRKELRHFRTMPDGSELVLETLIGFCQFQEPAERIKSNDCIGTPPPVEAAEKKMEGQRSEVPESVEGVCARNDDTNSINEDVGKFSQYSQVKLCAKTSQMAVVYPSTATQEEIDSRKCRRVEIFKMPNWEYYVIHDINENNIIVGTAMVPGSVRVSDSMIIEGFGGKSINYDPDPDIDMVAYAEKEASNDLDEREKGFASPSSGLPPSFYPPSFGVTVLGNSHGFDSSGSVSGYVLWINGRGIMIDPPPYSSATLEREGILPRTIVGIILTHCHADHDAGAFQKVLTGSPIIVIATPTIYKSFIRKYAALSSLSPILLRHSHRHKPAIIGEPMRFQGAIFHFTYTLHSIPCVGFRVEWGERSMVFTGDHFNSPKAIDKLQETGVLSKARAKDLKQIPLQNTDLLLHESGAPPIHTPLEVLLALPKHIKDHLYVVHTQALPPGCELQVAPTGTKGTIRLDELDSSIYNPKNNPLRQSVWGGKEHGLCNGTLSAISEAESHGLPSKSSITTPPRVLSRPPSTSDTWYMMNLLSAVPFLSSLSYLSAMEVLETALVHVYSINDIVVEASERNKVLCVVWEGTCMEREMSSDSKGKAFRFVKQERSTVKDAKKRRKQVWFAGDWTGPISLQPSKRLSGESPTSKTHDIVGMSKDGVKVIKVEFATLDSILKRGSPLYCTYLSRRNKMESPGTIPECLKGTSTGHLFENSVRTLNTMDIINMNYTFRKLFAFQKRHLECLAEGPVYYPPGYRLWNSGAPVDKAFIIVDGTVSFIHKRRNAGSFGMGRPKKSSVDENKLATSLGELMMKNAAKVRADFDTLKKGDDDCSSNSSISSLDLDADSAGNESLTRNDEIGKLAAVLDKRANKFNGVVNSKHNRSDESSTDISHDGYSTADYSFQSDDLYGDTDYSVDSARQRRRSSKERFANKQIERLFNDRAFTAGLIFSRGHFLGDISKMVEGLLLSSDGESNLVDDDSVQYGFGEKYEDRRGPIGDMIIHEQEGGQLLVHSKTLAAGKDGCVVLVFPKSSLIPLFDEYPGLLFSLLGAEVKM